MAQQTSDMGDISKKNDPPAEADTSKQNAPPAEAAIAPDQSTKKPKKKPVEIDSEDLGLQMLYPEEGSPQAGKIEIDVVAVHGIGANPNTTWTAPKKSVGNEEKKAEYVNWLKAPEMLPKVIPKARIMGFAYESNWTGEAAVKQRLQTVAHTLLKFLVMERRDCKYRPIVFIGHCFGGLVIQKAYSLARANEDDWAGIGVSTTGMVFMGTPHHGTNTFNSQGALYNAIAKQAEMRVQDNVLRALEVGNEALSDALSEFMRLVNVKTARIQICCFFEQKETNVGVMLEDQKDPMKEFVVDEKSGSLEGHQNFGLPLDHFRLNKFSSPRDANFRMVRDVIRDMVVASADMMKSRNLPHKSVTTVEKKSQIPSLPHRVDYRPLSRPPFLRDAKFVSHEDILQRIEEKFEKHERIALYGSSGIGKTHTAIEYAHKYNEEHPGAKVLWVNARSAEQFEHAYRTIGQELSIQGLKDPKKNFLQVVHRYLSQEAHGQWLMVLDGADDEETFLKKRTESSSQEKPSKQRTLLDHVPRCPGGIVLITSQSPTLAFQMVEQQMGITMEINSLKVEESISLFRMTFSEEVYNDQQARELVNALHQSPMAITQATAYILARGTETTIPDYLTSLKSQTLQLGGENPNSAETAAIGTWQMLYELIRQKHPESASLLSVVSVLDLQSIPMFLLRKWSGDKSQVKKAISTLTQFGMITTFANQESISASRLAQRSTQAWLKQKGEKTLAEERALSLLTTSFPGTEHEEYKTCEILYQYVHVVLGFKISSIASKLHRATLLFKTAGYSKHLGKYDEARQYLEESLKLREEELDKDNDQIKETKNALEALRESQRQTDTGTPSAKDGSGKPGTTSPSAFVRASKWPKAVKTVSKVQNMMQLTQKSLDQEQHQEAEARSKEGLEECEKTLGEDHLDTIRMADYYAMALQNQGRQAEALILRNRVLDWCKAKYGPKHQDTIQQTYNLALAYDLQGEYGQATSLCLQALENAKELSVADNPMTLRILSSLATIYDAQGRTEEAKNTFHEALEAQQATLGSDHPDTLLTMHNLALCAQSCNDLTTAEHYLELVLSKQEEFFGPEHSTTLRTVSNLALNFRLKRQYEEAEQLYQMALEGQKNRLGDLHPDTLATRHMLAELYEEVGRVDEAREQYRVSLEGREKALGSTHQDTIYTRKRLARLGNSAGSS